MDAADMLTDAFGRLPALVQGAVRDLPPERLRWAPADGANSIGWLVWHLTRV
jgi:DinB superfamily